MTNEPGSTYVRPTWPAQVFRDEAGDVLVYGNRWRGSPPRDAYEVTSNLDRFAPLHLVAWALVDSLVRDHHVVVSEGQDLVRTLEPGLPDFVRLVRVASEEPRRGRSMTIAFTAFPGVMVYRGATFLEAFPACGCDACDDSVDHVAARLEERVLALANEELGWSRRI